MECGGLADNVGGSNAISVNPIKDSSSGSLDGFPQESVSLQETSEHVSSFIWKVLVFEDFVLLFLNTTDTDFDHDFPHSNVTCLFHSAASRPVSSSALGWSMRAIWCETPDNSHWSHLTGQNVTAIIGTSKLSSSAVFNGTSAGAAMVYESVDAGNGSTLVFAKGLPLQRRREPNEERIRCLYGDGVTQVAVKVAGSCLEGVLCKPPSGKDSGVFAAGAVLTLSADNQTLASVGRVRSLPGLRFPTRGKGGQRLEDRERAPGGGGSGQPHFHICMCTVIRDHAKYLREWVTYHAHLGVERVILYDNGSADDIDSVVDSLQAFNVTKYPWPWIKAQEAGFAHCATRAREICVWLLFVDVDEFPFPAGLLLGPRPKPGQKPTRIPVSEGSALGAIIQKAEGVVEGEGKVLGSIGFKCQSFGASGLEELPPSGQAANYVCRMRKANRFKSLVRLKAVGGPRCNNIHHFSHVKESGYVEHVPHIREAVVKHFKFPVWKEFRQKFKRRASTVVRDWNDNNATGLEDKVVGLTTDLEEPPDWRLRFCEVNDTDLQTYVKLVFSDPKLGLLPWER